MTNPDTHSILTTVEELRKLPPGTVLIGAHNIGDRREYSIYMWDGHHLRLYAEAGRCHPANVLHLGEMEVVWQP